MRVCVFCFVGMCAIMLRAKAESTLKTSTSTPVATSEILNPQENEAAFRQAVGSTLGSLGFSSGGGGASGPGQGFQSAVDSSSYQPPYNALNSVYGITYHGDYNQLANYLQPGIAGSLKPNQKPTISSRFRHFMNSLFFRRSNKHPPAFIQPPSGNFGGSGYDPSSSFSGFGSSAVGTVVPNSFGSFANNNQGHYDFSTLVGSPSTGSPKGGFGSFSSGARLGNLNSVSTATAFGPARGPFGSGGADTSFGNSAGSFGSLATFAGSSPTFGSSQTGSVYNRFEGSSSTGSTATGGTTYFPGDTVQRSSLGASSVYQGSSGAFGKGVEDSKSDEDRDVKEEQE